MPRFARAIFIAAIVTVFGLPSAVSAQQKTYSQAPEVAPSEERGTAAAPVAALKPVNINLEAGPRPSWIWGAAPEKIYLLKTTFEGGSTAARLKASCDNAMKVFVNGKEVTASEEWEQPVDVDVQKHIKPGKNELVAEVNNEGNVAGFVLKLGLKDASGAVRYVVTDASWTAAEKRDPKATTAVKLIAPLGASPWGDVLSKPASPLTSKRGVFEVPAGFKVERLFTVPKDELGSWVSCALDNKGRLIVSDQGNFGLCRITPAPLDGKGETKVERLSLPTAISGAMGLLYAFDSLYVDGSGAKGNGIYRLRDTNGDDQYDAVDFLKTIAGGGEHGPHGLRLSPDGKSIYIVAGNHTPLPQGIEASRVPRNWNEDHLLPPQWDANGHARGILAPGGWIAKFDADGKNWEIMSTGYRNSYDIAFNGDGDLFAYDSDMEWDMGMPWYRPTRAVHATSGSEFGWRSGTGKWPTYYIDSLPPLVNIGPGSPVGVTFGYGAKFPAKYQKALYLCDWTFGTIYALHLEPEGSTYRAEKTEFLSRTPLPLTDIVVGADGALYFTVGGRGTQSEFFRVTYTGTESTAPIDRKETAHAEQRELRRSIEQYHSKKASEKEIQENILPYLEHKDRFIRYAARVALEHQPAAVWQDRVLAIKPVEGFLTGAVALAHQGDKSLQPKVIARLEDILFSALPESQKLDLLRVWSLVFMRMGAPDAATSARLAKAYDGYFPADSDFVNRELCGFLIYLKSPTVVGKTIALLAKLDATNAESMSDLLARNPGYGGSIARMIATRPDAQKLHYAFVLRNATAGWNLDLRKQYFTFLRRAHEWAGGASFDGFLNNIEKDAFENATDAERLAIEATGARTPYKAPVLPKPQGPGHAWKKEDVLALTGTKLKSGRSFENGQRTFAAARCVVCHRFGGEGGATGPDLTQAAGRFSAKDLAEAILEPSKIISDQYRASVIETDSGKVITGRVVNEVGDNIVVVTDPEDSSKVVELSKKSVEGMKPSPVSLMPERLLDPLNENEVLDLLAYVLSRGDANDPMFRKR